MAYEIPPPLQHKEKIIFGLNLHQLAIAAPSFILIVLCFKLLPLYVAITIGTLILCIAIFFILFDGIDKTKNLLQHLRNQEAEVNSNTLQDIVDIKEVKDNVVITEKQKLAILEVIPLNFLIKTKDEQESIITNFQKFLNSLSFPIQIHISSNTINLDDHFKILENKTKEHKELFESYKDFIQSSIQDNNIKNRKFYIIINEKDNINIQTKVCQDKLTSLGVKVKRLHTNQLLQLFHEYVANSKKKEVKEGQIIKNYTHFLVSPNKITFHHDFFEVDDVFCSVMAVTGYPHSVEMGFLDKIISSGENYDISLHIDPFPIETTMIQLNRELQKQQSDLFADSKKGILNPSLEIKHKSTRAVLEDLQKGKQKLFNVSLYIMCKGSTKEEMQLLMKKVKADLDGLMIQSTTPMFQMMNAYESMLPLGRDSIK